LYRRASTRSSALSSASLSGITASRAAKVARCGERDVIEEHDEDVRSTLRWEQRLDRREHRPRIPRIERHVAVEGGVWDGKARPDALDLRHDRSSLPRSCQPMVHSGWRPRSTVTSGRVPTII
jgi:hypothetical protein